MDLISASDSNRVASGIKSIKLFLEGYADTGLTPTNHQHLEVLSFLPIDGISLTWAII